MFGLVEHGANMFLRTGVVDAAMDALSPEFVALKQQIVSQARAQREQWHKINGIALAILTASLLIMASSSSLLPLGLLGAVGSALCVARGLNAVQICTNQEKMAERITTYITLRDGKFFMDEERILEALTEGCFLQSYEKELHRPSLRAWNTRPIAPRY